MRTHQRDRIINYNNQRKDLLDRTKALKGKEYGFHGKRYRIDLCTLFGEEYPTIFVDEIIKEKDPYGKETTVLDGREVFKTEAQLNTWLDRQYKTELKFI